MKVFLKALVNHEKSTGIIKQTVIEKDKNVYYSCLLNKFKNSLYLPMKIKTDLHFHLLEKLSYINNIPVNPVRRDMALTFGL